MKDKIATGEAILQAEEDKFENEFGRYKNRSDTKIVDIINAINQANDVGKVVEGDMAKIAPNFDYRNYHVETECEQNEHGHGKGKCEESKGGHGKKHDKEHDKKHDKKHDKEHGKKHGKRDEIDSDDDSWERKRREARGDHVYLWINRIVPYEIDSALSESAEIIKYAMQQIQENTCIKFVPHSSESNWLKFVKKSGCWSSVGRTFWLSGFQEISLGSNCVYIGIIIHEVLHSLGFWHEQSRPDRDQYVEIFWENIKAGEQHNFDKYGHALADVMHAPYDYGSIMHYGKYSFALNSEKPTILSLTNPSTTTLGQRNALSPTDIFQINELYDCKNKGTGWSNWSGFGPCDSNCNKEQTRFCMDPNDRQKCPHPLSTSLRYWGVDVNKVKCSAAECNAPIDGHWNKWGDWGGCSVTCDMGTQTRTRECTDPIPQNGGKYCVGDSSSSQPCQKRSCSSGPYDCTFDVEGEKLCSWKLDPTGNFNWIRNSGGTPSSSTGPEQDHTSGSGYYMFIESSTPAQAGWKARLLSSNMPAGDRCMTFYYNMYGASTGSLNAQVKYISTGQVNRVFAKSGDQLKGWNEAKVDITATDTYHVIFEAVRGDSFQGDIAIDDIIIKDGTCAGGVPPTTVAPPVPTVSRVGCYHNFGYINGFRPFPQVKSFRDRIVWERLNATSWDIVHLCSTFARQNGYEYFTIEYWGECWTGPTADVNYGRDGEATDCWPTPDKHLGPYLVGKSFTMMVYKWVNSID